MTRAITDILECPATGKPLQHLSPDALTAVDGPSYPLRDGIHCFAPDMDADDAIGGVRDYYDRFGWQRDENGMFREINAAVDTRGPSIGFTRDCMKRLGKYFEGGGAYLLDAGCGPLAHKELIEYSRTFEKRICVDLSFQALQIAQAQLGDKGIYIQGSITNLPIKSNSIDAVSCYHVIYQVPPHLQAAAFTELWRVLKPGGVCVAVYWWPNPQLPRWLGLMARLLAMRPDVQAVDANTSAPMPQTSHDKPFSRKWFDAQPWPFDYEYDTYRVVDNAFMRHRVSDDWRGRGFLKALYTLQRLAPHFCGRHGAIPAIIIRKAETRRVSS